MVTYSTNWMGPVNRRWFENRGLINENGNVETYYSCGRIDIRDDTKEGYDGWNEYSVAPMHGEDWNALGDFLWNFETEELVPYDILIAQFEEHYGKKIRWADDIWCPVCFGKGYHKMGCNVKYASEEDLNIMRGIKE